MCTSLMTEDIEHIFQGANKVFAYLLLKCLSLLTVLLGSFSFMMICGVLYAPWMLFSCQSYISQSAAYVLLFVYLFFHDQACHFILKYWCILFISFMVSPLSFLGNLCHSYWELFQVFFQNFYSSRFLSMMHLELTFWYKM